MKRSIQAEESSAGPIANARLAEYTRRENVTVTRLPVVLCCLLKQPMHMTLPEAVSDM